MSVKCVCVCRCSISYIEGQSFLRDRRLSSILKCVCVLRLCGKADRCCLQILSYSITITIQIVCVCLCMWFLVLVLMTSYICTIYPPSHTTLSICISLVVTHCPLQSLVASFYGNRNFVSSHALRRRLLFSCVWVFNRVYNYIDLYVCIYILVYKKNDTSSIIRCSLSAPKNRTNKTYAWRHYTKTSPALGAEQLKVLRVCLGVWMCACTSHFA